MEALSHARTASSAGSPRPAATPAANVGTTHASHDRPAGSLRGQSRRDLNASGWPASADGDAVGEVVLDMDVRPGPALGEIRQLDRRVVDVEDRRARPALLEPDSVALLHRDERDPRLEPVVGVGRGGRKAPRQIRRGELDDREVGRLCVEGAWLRVVADDLERVDAHDLAGPANTDGGAGDRLDDFPARPARADLHRHGRLGGVGQSQPAFGDGRDLSGKPGPEPREEARRQQLVAHRRPSQSISQSIGGSVQPESPTTSHSGTTVVAVRRPDGDWWAADQVAVVLSTTPVLRWVTAQLRAARLIGSSAGATANPVKRRTEAVAASRSPVSPITPSSTRSSSSSGSLRICSKSSVAARAGPARTSPLPNSMPELSSSNEGDESCSLGAISKK